MGKTGPLLQQGNSKLGDSIHHFYLPAVSTCSGRSATCERAMPAKDATSSRR